MSGENGGKPQANLYACCFCGEPEAEPLSIEVVFNWFALVEAAVSEELGAPMPEAIHQQWFAHPKCLVKAFHPTVREFSPEVEEFLRRDDSYRSGAYE